MQEGESPQYIKASSCLKHFAAYNLENWHGVDRHHFDAKVSQQDLADTYWPPFQAGITIGNASGLMCSCECDLPLSMHIYPGPQFVLSLAISAVHSTHKLPDNSINGVPSCANEPMMNGMARKQWGFDGCECILRVCTCVCPSCKSHSHMCMCSLLRCANSREPAYRSCRCDVRLRRR